MWSRLLMGGKTLKIRVDIPYNKNFNQLKKAIKLIIRYVIINIKCENNEYRRNPVNRLRKRYLTHCRKMLRTIPTETLLIAEDVLLSDIFPEKNL